ncbi:YcgN family cysteine cluster protein [Robiginitomaculum antarcticum]|uniref:YcgN family cysteine cluster protein n=1 Tax=Robiginitomaculum antarcticum TaxID=437507 RepID=UPI0003691544|nr:YcgN family cysteine cluster protein [Robiginitomaculum antarcticum]
MTQASIQPNFWETKSLREMSKAEWESLCDGCGKCCCIRLEDEDDGAIYVTNLSCKLLCTQKAQCSDYTNRKSIVPDCVQITPEKAATLKWMPKTCAYRLIAHGEPLPDYHHLISGSRQTIHDVGMSVAGAVTSEVEVPDGEQYKYITQWPGEDEI